MPLKSLHAGLLLAAVCAGAIPARAQHSILTDTLAEQSYVDLEKEAEAGAVALWALGSIEEHGPHLPLSADVEIPSAQLRGVKRLLAAEGVRAVIVPPYYWGVNHVTGDFAGSIDIRPEVMVELMLDVFRSLSRAGLRDVYCVTGHFDAAHGKAIADAVERANAERIIRAHFVVPDPLGKRLGLKPSDTILFADWPAGPPVRFADLHAGEGETSALLDVDPRLVRERLAKTLPPTRLSPDDIARWRRGGEEARALTPDGYLGDPARASQAAGRKQLDATARTYADQILRSAGQKH